MKQIKKWLTILSVLAIICVNMPIIHAEDDNTQKGEGDLLQQILDRGELIVGTSPDFPPMEFIDTTKTGQDQYVG